MKKRLKRVLIAIIALLVFISAAFIIYASNYYKADDTAKEVLQGEAVKVQQNKLIILSPAAPSDTALIFYPGAKVEYSAYLPILEKIEQKTGITCILLKMPFNMAIFDSNAADRIIAQFPEIKNWYIGGHSMGGAMAGNYASKNQDKVKGLILLGSYIYGNYPPKKTITIYGTLNQSVAEKINYSENVVAIEGGNHAQFGNYGKQKGDLDASISGEEQQNIAVEAIRDFLAERKK